MIYAIAILAPLAGSLIAGAFGRALGDRFAYSVTIAGMVLASVCGVASLFDAVYAAPPPATVDLGVWFDIGQFHLDWRCGGTRSARSWWRWSPAWRR